MLSRLPIFLLTLLIYNCGVLSVSADLEFIKAVEEKGAIFAYAKSVFSTEEPPSKKNAVLQSSQIYPDTQVCTVDGSYLDLDLDLKMRSFHLGIQRFYRSVPDRMGLFGSGWKLGYEIQLYSLDFDGVPAIAVERADGQIIIYQQGQSGFVSPFGNSFMLIQNEDGTYVNTSLGGKKTFFDEQGRLSKIVENKYVKPLEMRYDQTTGLLTEIRRGSQVLVRFMYNANDHIETVEDFTGRRYSYHYDEYKRLVEVIDPLQQRLQYRYDQNGYLQAIVDRRGLLQTEITYTPMGQVKSYTRNGEKYQIKYLGETQTTLIDTQGHQWTYSYLPSGFITQTQDPYGNTSSRKYDAYLRLIQERDKLGAVTKYLYDDVNRIKQIITPLGSVTTQIYKDREWVIKMPPGKIMTTHFNENEDIVEETFGTNEKILLRNRYVYDSAGNLVQHIDPRGNTTRFAYNSDGYLIEKIDGSGNVTHWQYDNLGRIVWKKDPKGQITETFYDLRGRVSDITRPSGSATQQ